MCDQITGDRGENPIYGRTPVLLLQLHRTGDTGTSMIMLQGDNSTCAGLRTLMLWGLH